ncbi:Crp/Fnr family transcriptional regulator [Polluticoccus soli]|uniref:Crp/Fnr family transcriptional regulator n=1 Tax=Polluticoccus soli TaxID=3034150 RepID=UPI0023E2299C|nr:Crp/Fnr family transcriptional regulator [Flavipsychrobacter sp. JY13-12]
MSSALQQHIQKFTSIGGKEMKEILSFFETIELKKKQNLLTEGSVCKHSYFVVKGLLRMFFINDKGVEQTTQFALENWWIADYTSFERQEPSEFNIQSVEKAEVMAITYAAQEILLQQHPSMERYFRMVHQRAHAAAQFRIKSLYGLSREESYHLFADRHPEFVQRVPQYLLASFLGFTPEYLSEIRAKRKS